MAFDTETLYKRKRKMRGPRSSLKPFGIYSFLVKDSDQEEIGNRYPLLVHFEVPRYNIRRGVYGLNLLAIEKPGIRNKLIQDYIDTEGDKAKLAALFQQTGNVLRESARYREAYKYYEWRNIASGLFVEIDPLEAKRILRSNVFER